MGGEKGNPWLTLAQLAGLAVIVVAVGWNVLSSGPRSAEQAMPEQLMTDTSSQANGSGPIAEAKTQSIETGASSNPQRHAAPAEVGSEPSPSKWLTADQQASIDEGTRAEEKWVQNREDFFKKELELSGTLVEELNRARQEISKREEELAAAPVTSPDQAAAIAQKMKALRDEYQQTLRAKLGEPGWQQYERYLREQWKLRADTSLSALHLTLM